MNNRSSLFYLFAFISTLVLVFSSIAYAATEVEMKNKINETNSQIEKINQEITRYQNMINTTGAQKTTLSNTIKELTLTRDKLLIEKQKTEKQIQATSMVIGGLSTNIMDKQKNIDMSKNSIATLLYKEYQNEKRTTLEVVLSSEDFSDAGLDYYAATTLGKKLSSSIKVISDTRDELIASKTKKEIEEKNLQILKNTLIQKQKTIEIAKIEKDNLLKETKNKEAEYQKLLAEQQKKRDAFEKDLRDYESQLKFILNPKLLPGSGVLSWPLDSVFITQMFGKTTASRRLYVSGSHSGVDLRASLGTRVMSMGDGTVIGVGNTDDYCKGASFGKWVFIRYNNGLSSTYGHLSVIDAKAGQKVSTGDVVGYSGNTGHSTGP
ncbi:MAG: peptidoglycan DD-metalloendopeptidase family protein, partial [Candidatus Nomurabacteria bacterium]|nr:peptidoglycan DD-metalloendopeptidase family protein [Candidatus Nomurabacteria bacterium]